MLVTSDQGQSKCGHKITWPVRKPSLSRYQSQIERNLVLCQSCSSVQLVYKMQVVHVIGNSAYSVKNESHTLKTIAAEGEFGFSIFASRRVIGRDG